MQLLFLWVLISTVALVVDLITSSFLFVWFTIGGIAAIIALALNYSFIVQLITFVSVSALFIIVGYPMVKGTIKKTVQKTPTMEEGYIGRVLEVDNDVVEKALIKIDGIYWTIKNDGDPIKSGDKIKVIGLQGNKIVVEKF